MNVFKTICFWMIPKITISISFNKVETYNVKVEDSTATFNGSKLMILIYIQLEECFY